MDIDAAKVFDYIFEGNFIAASAISIPKAQEFSDDLPCYMTDEKVWYHSWFVGARAIKMVQVKGNVFHDLGLEPVDGTGYFLVSCHGYGGDESNRIVTDGDVWYEVAKDNLLCRDPVMNLGYAHRDLVVHAIKEYIRADMGVEETEDK
jgi:hypothetical protein